MKAVWSGKLSAAKSGWLIALLFFGWLAFFIVPAPKPDPQPAPPVVKLPPSRLVALGLPDNPDLERLPEYFELYADKAEWKDNRTIFAYWNPGSSGYSYFVEVIRKDGKFRFHLKTKLEAYRSMTHEGDGAYSSSDYVPDDATVATVEPITESPTHPVVLFHSYPVINSLKYEPRVGKPSIGMTPNNVSVDLKVDPQPMPKVEIKNPPKINE